MGNFWKYQPHRLRYIISSSFGQAGDWRRHRSRVNASHEHRIAIRAWSLQKFQIHLTDRVEIQPDHCSVSFKGNTAAATQIV